MATRSPVCINDFREYAEECLPRKWFEYQQGGAMEEQTVKDNVNAFKRLRLKPRILRDVSKRDLSTCILGRHISCPIAVAPTAYHKMSHPEGEIATAKGATSIETSMIVSSHGSNIHLRDVISAVPAESTLWIQIYLYKDKTVTRRIVEMAQKAGYRALVVTIDTPITGKKMADIRNGLANMAYTEFYLPTQFRLPNIEAKRGEEFRVNFDISVTWSDIDWLRSITSLPIVVKGILTAEDTKEALRHDIDGIIVSNHGGRQLDGVLATIDALPEVVQAAKGSGVEIYLDGGVRMGTDVLKALALGAKAVFIGRPILWGLAYNGFAGVRCVLDMLREELSQAMALTGCRNLSEITADIILFSSNL